MDDLLSSVLTPSLDFPCFEGVEGGVWTRGSGVGDSECDRLTAGIVAGVLVEVCAE